MNSCALEDSSLRSIFRRVMQFYKPTSNQFCQCEFNSSRTRLYSVVGCFLMDSLTVVEEVTHSLWIDDWSIIQLLGDFYSWNAKRFWPNSLMMLVVLFVIFLWLRRLMTVYLVLDGFLQQLAGTIFCLSGDWAALLMELMP